MQIFYLLINQYIYLSRIRCDYFDNCTWWKDLNTSSTTINIIINLCSLHLYNLVRSSSLDKWSKMICIDPCTYEHVCVLICVFAVKLRSQSQLISSLIQIMRQNDDKLIPFSCCTKAMNFECDKRWNSFATTIRSCLPELSLSPLLCAGSCSLSICGWANPTTQSAL